MRGKRAICIWMVLMVLTLPVPSLGSANIKDGVMEDTAAFLMRTVPSPQVASIGGEWTVIGLARSGVAVPDAYFDTYYKNLEAFTREQNGVLHTRKYTEYARVTLALTAIGKNPRDVAGYDLLLPLGDFDAVVWQGVNGAASALLALDAGEYAVPACPAGKTQATRELYVQNILSHQQACGGFGLSDQQPDVDVTGIVLQALSKYQDIPAVQEATNRALDWLSSVQDDTGGYESFGAKNLESNAQVITALCELGVSLDDSRFVKNGQGLLDDLLRYYQPGNGFMHTMDGETNVMATEQAFYALSAVLRVQAREPSLYRMHDATEVVQPSPDDSKIHPDVAVPAVCAPQKAFDDISGHANETAILALAAREIINGKTETQFFSDDSMTRAEFAAVLTRSLGLLSSAPPAFSDVSSDSWYAGAVAAAADYGLVSGTAPGIFSPDGTITRQEAAVMCARAAALLGMDANIEAEQARNILAQFIDFPQIADWAKPQLAFCYQRGMLSQDDLSVRPQDAVTRGEVAQMLYGLLLAADLL